MSIEDYKVVCDENVNSEIGQPYMKEYQKGAPPSPWIPEDDKIRLAILGKFAEELAECGTAVARCIVQGVDGKNPVTGKPNLEWLKEEMADVFSELYISMSYFDIKHEDLEDRIDDKIEHKLQWHKLILERYTVPRCTDSDAAMPIANEDVVKCIVCDGTG